MTTQVILVIAKNGTIIVGKSGTDAANAALARLAYAAGSGEALGVGITAGTAAAPTIAEYGMFGQEAQEFVTEFMEGNTPEASKVLYSAIAGLVIGGAASAGGLATTPALIFGASVGAGYKEIWTQAYNASSQVDWNKRLDLLYELLGMITDGWGYIFGEVGSWFVLGQSVVFRRDPLTFDLDGDGLETVSAAQSGVLFDHDGDGIQTGAKWGQALPFASSRRNVPAWPVLFGSNSPAPSTTSPPAVTGARTSLSMMRTAWRCSKSWPRRCHALTPRRSPIA